jgi:hypothetical protein
MKRTMDDGEFRKRVLLKIAAAPSVLLPIAAGGTALLAAWGFGQPVGLLSFLGVAGVLTGVGALATRWIFGVERATREVADEAEDEQRRMRDKEIARLERRLRRDKDPRSQQYLRRLRKMVKRFREETAEQATIPSAQVAEITAHSDRLFRSCVASLERSLVLWRTAQKMHTESAKAATLEARERVFEEVEASIEHLARIFDGVHTLSLADDGQGRMASIREELEASLNVARRVEERMQTIRESLEGDPATVADRAGDRMSNRPAD